MLLEAAEVLLDEGLELTKNDRGLQLGTEFDLDGLLRMDTSTKVKAAHDAVGSGGMSSERSAHALFRSRPGQGRRDAVSSSSRITAWRRWPSAIRTSRSPSRRRRSRACA